MSQAYFLIIPSLSLSTSFKVILKIASNSLLGLVKNAFKILCVFKVLVLSLSKNLKAYFIELISNIVNSRNQ